MSAQAERLRRLVPGPRAAFSENDEAATALLHALDAAYPGTRYTSDYNTDLQLLAKIDNKVNEPQEAVSLAWDEWERKPVTKRVIQKKAGCTGYV